MFSTHFYKRNEESDNIKIENPVSNSIGISIRFMTPINSTSDMTAFLCRT